MRSLTANGNIVFNQLTTTGITSDPGNIDLTSTSGSIIGGSISANGDVILNTGTSITLNNLSGSSISLSAPGSLTITDVKVVKELDLAANIINVSGSQIPSTPSIPLIMNLTGYHGGSLRRPTSMSIRW